KVGLYTKLISNFLDAALFFSVHDQLFTALSLSLPSLILGGRSWGKHSAESFSFKAHDYFSFLVILRHVLRPILLENLLASS
ncbi:hypothetical protein Tsubulata_021993, partial [Turnera subulata]